MTDRLCGWHHRGIHDLVRHNILHIVLPGRGVQKKATGPDGWLPGPERRALVALDNLRHLGGFDGWVYGGGTSAQRAAQRTVAQAARSHLPATLVDITDRQVVTDPESWVARWRSRGGPQTLLVRVPEDVT